MQALCPGVVGQHKTNWMGILKSLFLCLILFHLGIFWSYLCFVYLLLFPFLCLCTCFCFVWFFLKTERKKAWSWLCRVVGRIRGELGERGNNDQNILYENIFQKKWRKEKKNKFDLIIGDYRSLPDGLEPGRVFSGLGLTEAHWPNYVRGSISNHLI